MHSEAFLRLHEVLSRHGRVTALLSPDSALPSTPFQANYQGLLSDPDLDSWLWAYRLTEVNYQRRREEWIGRLDALDAALAGL